MSSSVYISYKKGLRWHLSPFIYLYVLHLIIVLSSRDVDFKFCGHIGVYFNVDRIRSERTDIFGQDDFDTELEYAREYLEQEGKSYLLE